jgi:hypothetical protein
MDRQLRSDLRDVIAGQQPGALADLADLIRGWTVTWGGKSPLSSVFATPLALWDSASRR